MPIDKGSVNFAVIRTTASIDVGFAKEFVQESYKQGNPSADAQLIDLSSGASLLPPEGREITEDDFLRDSIPYFALRKREVKIDSAKLKEMVSRAVEEKRLQGLTITGKMMKEIKATAKDALSMSSQVKISGTRATFSPTGFCYVESTSVKKTLDFIEDLSSMIPLENLGTLRLVDFSYMATASKYDPDQYSPLRFSEHESISGIGTDFLTYLLAAANGGVTLPPGIQLTTPGAIEMVDCTTSNAGAKVVSMKDGIPCAGREISSCISSGKKVSSMDINVQFGDNAAFMANIDLDFCVKKFSQVRGDEEEETFADRVQSMDQFLIGIAKLFAVFIDLVKTDGDALAQLIKSWASDRKEGIPL